VTRQLVRPVPLDLDQVLQGPPPHPNCRCTGAGGRAPVGLALETVGAGEQVRVQLILPVDGNGVPKPVAQQTFTDAVLEQIAAGTGTLLADLTAEHVTPDDIGSCTVQFKFEDGLKDTLEEMAKQLGGLDVAVVREAARQAAAAAEEQVRYTMVIGEPPPAGVSPAEMKAAVDYYLATGRLPWASVPPAPALPRPRPAPPVAAHRRAMKLKGKMR
jgi:hypothetical protein